MAKKTTGQERAAPFDLPEKSPEERKRAKAIYKDLLKRYPDAHCELTYTKPHELLIATILSAQATDVGVNKATPALFERFPTPEAFAKSSPEEIEPFVRSLGFFRNKSRAVHEAMKSVVEEHGGEVPRTMEGLLTLRGVARKTANVVLGNAFGLNEGVPVDTHVQRLSRLYGLAPAGANPVQIEKHLMALFPREDWCMVSHLLIWHGRRCATARTKPEDDPVFVKHCEGVVPTVKKGAKRAAKRTSKKKSATKKRAAKPTARKGTR
jgi:endonuclease-3